MSHSKIFYSLVVAGLIAFSNVAPAAVYDFGNSRTSLRSSNLSFNDDAFAQPMDFDFSTPVFNQTENSFMSIPQNQGGSTSVYSANGNSVNGLPYMDARNQFRRGIHNKLADDDWSKRSDKYTPITSPVPEPETYVMILAGLALIGFTARRRNQNS